VELTACIFELQELAKQETIRSMGHDSTFDHKDGGYIFLRTPGISLNYEALQARRLPNS
jgi:hypothetical protein